MNTTQTNPSTAPIRVAVTRTIEASADTLYALVTDITRMPEWSRETIATQWLDGATKAEVGARFAGKNRLGKNSWTTKPTIIAADRGQVFAFEVPGKSGPIWRYEFREIDGRTEVTESVVQQHRSSALIRFFQRRAGVTDRSANLRENITETLERLAAAAERADHIRPA
jgi:uncharacterized protein YndB with AHSA1/START domain